MESFDEKIASLYPTIKPWKSRYCELSVAIVLAPSFTITPVAGFLDVLRLAADEADFSRQLVCQWTILGDEAGQKIASSCGVEMLAWQPYGNPKNYDYVMVVGGQLPASFKLSERGYAFLKQAHQQSVKIIALCVGSFLLARLGLLDGKKCAVGFGHEHEMNVLFPDIQTYSDRLYLEDGNIITCPGGVSAIDLANTIVARHCGQARSVKTMRSMLVSNTRKPTEMPALHYEHAKNYGNWQIQQAIDYMESNFDRPIPIAELAKELGISLLLLKNAFKQFLQMTPLQFWQRIRMEHAHHLLLNTEKPVATIADECGYYDAAHFSKRCKAFYGATPLEIRQVSQRHLKIESSRRLESERPSLNQSTRFEQ